MIFDPHLVIVSPAHPLTLSRREGQVDIEGRAGVDIGLIPDLPAQSLDDRFGDT
jgi:hypothetical protein